MHTQKLLATTTVIAASLIAFAPTQASAFDIGGLIGTAMAIQMGGGHYRGGYSSGEHRTHVASHHESDSSDRGKSDVERDARDPEAATPASTGKSDNHVLAARAQKIQGPSSSNGGTAQASENDAGSQVASAAKSFDDAPAFNPSR
jgi:hypothetical protein